MEHYSLDVVISVGYRVKSAEGVRFRRWASDVLKQYVVEGAAVNQRRLAQWGAVVEILRRSDEDIVEGVAEVLSHYLPSLKLLQQYDEADLPTTDGSLPLWQLTYAEAEASLTTCKRNFPRTLCSDKSATTG